MRTGVLVALPFGREQNREYQLARYHRLRREAIARAGGKCVHCGDGGAGSAGDGVDPGSELGFEYATGCEPEGPSGAGGVRVKGGQLAKIWSKSKERIERELLRCVLLCRTCRTRKRSTERAEERGHGTITSYKYGCRCEACREIYNAYKREWRARQAAPVPQATVKAAAQATAFGKAKLSMQTDVIDITRITREGDEQPAAKLPSTRSPTRSPARSRTPLRACG